MTIKEETLYSNVETANSKQLDILKKHFPQCFDAQGSFIQERMLELVNESDVELSKESYSLNWLGKTYARLLANLPPKTLINEDREHNSQEQHKNSKNLLIKGDNLEVLKHLVNAYSEKVKMIYIDPPYNTGSDGFVYNDDRKFTKEQLAELAAIDVEEAERILSFNDKGSSTHSAWLTFIYPRLYVAKELLADDGVMFISIDDNELSQLKLICDEVFGEANFVGQFIVNSSPSAIDYGHIAKTHEYALFYAKDIFKATTKHLEDEEKTFKYRDEIGEFNLYPLYNGNVAFNPKTRPNLYYPFYLNPNKKDTDDFYEISLDKKDGWVEVYPVTSKKDNIPRVWRWGREKAKMNLNAEIVGYMSEQNEYRVVQKTRLTGKVIRSLHLDKNVSSRKGTAEVQELFGHKVFTFPKPVSLIQRFIEVSTFGNDVVLDFFSGSGTTAQALINHNFEKKTDNKFICVQLGEKTAEDTVAYQQGYKNIFEITKERIQLVATKIRDTDPEYSGDLGFKIFETVDDFRVEDDEKELTLSNLTLFDDVVLTNEQYRTLLTTWALYDGSELTAPIHDIDLNGYTAHLCDRRLYLIAPHFSSDSLKALLHKLDDTEDKDFDPNKIVYFANNFDSVKQMELNEALKSYANKKSIEIDVVVRN